jgi:hypothetical protein
MSGAWDDANAALLAARGLAGLPEPEARRLVALLHTGTLVELPDPAATAALDLERLARVRALEAGTLTGAERAHAAIGLLALGHREPARALRREDAEVAAAWSAWVGEGQGGDGAAALEVEGLRIAPAASRGELAVEVRDPLPARVGVRRLRVAGTVLDLELRRRPTGPVLRIARAHGPSVVVTVALPPRFGTATVDEVDGLVAPLRFEVRERHEVVAYG